MSVTLSSLLQTNLPSGFSGVSGFSAVSGFSGFSGPIQVNIPQSTNTTVVSTDAGKHITSTSNVTFNTSTGFSTGDTVCIYNNSGSNITIVATGVTMYFAGTALTGNRTLGQRGISSVLCVSANTYVISGSGIS